MEFRQKGAKPLQDNPQLFYKTRICKDWEEGRCHCGKVKCTFAHGEEDLKKKAPKPLPKAGPHSVCKFYASGHCKNGDLCNFKHQKQEKRREDTSFEEDWGNDGFQTVTSDSRMSVYTRESANASSNPRSYKEVASSASSRPSSSEELEKDLAKMTTKSASDETFPWSACLHIYNLGLNLSMKDIQDMFARFNCSGAELHQNGKELEVKVYFPIFEDAKEARQFYSGLVLDDRAMLFEISRNPDIESSNKSIDFCSTQSTSSSSMSSQDFYFGEASTSDFTLQVGETKYHIHKAIVAHHSSFFKGLFIGTPVKTGREEQDHMAKKFRTLVDLLGRYH